MIPDAFHYIIFSDGDVVYLGITIADMRFDFNR
jgi:hypothetical protein